MAFPRILQGNRQFPYLVFEFLGNEEDLGIKGKPLDCRQSENLFRSFAPENLKPH